MAVALCRCGLGRITRHRVRAWRHNDGRFWMTLSHAGGNVLLVVGAVAGEGGERVLDLVEQGAHLRAIVHVLGGQQGGDDRSGNGVHAEVQLTPRPAHLRAMFLMQPFARATELEARAVHQQVHGFRAGAEAWLRHLQRLRPAAKRAVVGDGEIEPEQPYDGADQALCLAQSQPKYRTQGQRRQDSQRRVGPLPAPGRPWFSRPRRNHLRSNPNRQASALAQARVIRRPVRDFELLLGDVVATVGVQLEGQDGIQGLTETNLLPRPGLGRHQPDPCNNAS